MTGKISNHASFRIHMDWILKMCYNTMSMCIMFFTFIFTLHSEMVQIHEFSVMVFQCQNIVGHQELRVLEILPVTSLSANPPLLVVLWGWEETIQASHSTISQPVLKLLVAHISQLQNLTDCSILEKVKAISWLIYCF